MKSPYLVASLSLFLFSALATKPLLGAPEPLLDFRGDKVLAGTPYYVLAMDIGVSSGGISATSGRNQICPLDVIHEPRVRGLPLVFSPANGETYVYESADLNIKFGDVPNTCNQSTSVWKVDGYDPSRGQWFITTDGVEGNPGAHTLGNWFKFEKLDVDRVYKLVHCPSVCESCTHLCSGVSVYYEDNVGRLALGSGYYTISFITVEEHLSKLKESN
ncbi:hypothetical protein ACOSQ2_024251 [Xanthoceras sorbifolium]|uniref:Uncharacterized protein n=1 Tax=Xanthoceras sorbifolium TaxID=99658 RepID=A0ABQ8H9Q2_9ROSI|nr:hypothetical protein JRO89_XS13G0230800 [Xanthoceras sorbifolium]